MIASTDNWEFPTGHIPLIPEATPSQRTLVASLISTLSGAVTAAALTVGIAGTLVVPDRTAPPLGRPMLIADPARRSLGSHAAVRTTATLVHDLRANSGLTWDQLGRLFGVSRRAVHLWAAGGRINAGHLELLTQFSRIVDSLPADNAAQRRALIFEPRRGEPNIFDNFVGRHSSEGGTVSGTPFTVDQLVGALHDTQRSH